MNSLLNYLLQVIIASGILYLYYHFALRNRKFHQYNRFYLLGSVLISVLIPFLDIPVYFTQQETQSSFVFQTLTILSSQSTDEPVSAMQAIKVAETPFNALQLLYYLYGLLATLALARIIVSLLKIRRLSRSYPVEQIDNIHFVNTKDPGTPFSFFRWLFWNQDIEINSNKGEQIFRHELYHIRQRHSFDIIFMELLTVIFWFNPFFHIMKKELRAIHEFLADRYAMKETEEGNYAETLIMQALQTRQSLVNPFFQTQIKRRIAMITNPQKTSHRYLRKLSVLPLAALLVILFAFKYKNHSSPAVLKSEKLITVVIDAGHGGDDPGGKSPDGKFIEADIALQLAMTVQRLAAEYNVNVVMTRNNSEYPGGATNKDDGIRNRVEITEKVKPLAFVSLHLNRSNGNEYRDDPSGIEAFVTNKRMDDPGKKMASMVLQELSTVYKTAPDLKYRTEAGIYVLDKNNCPTVILECGYIDNKNDVNFITNTTNQEKIARAILKGIVSFNAEQPSVAVVEPGTDSIPSGERQIYKYALIQVSSHFFIRTEGTRLKGHIYSFKPSEPKPDLIIVNGEEFTIAQAEQRFKGVIFKSPIYSVIPPGNEDALKKYGNKAKHGVLLFTDVIIVDKNQAKLEAELSPGTVLFVNGRDTKPLIVIDGIIQPFSDAKNKVPPESIESVNVLKDPSALSKYGKKGENGVVEITTKKSSGRVFYFVEIEPAFPGGETAWKKYLESNLDKSVPVSNNAPQGLYTVDVEFIVDIDGSISNVKALTNHGFGMEEEAIRIIKKVPSWQPALQNGQRVKAYQKLPIRFLVGTEKFSQLNNPTNAPESITPDLTVQRRQEIGEIKTIAKNSEDVGYIYKGRTYLFSNKEATSFSEQDGIDHTFLLNGAQVTLDDINKQVKRQDIKKLSLVSSETAQEKYKLEGNFIAVETFEK